MQMRVPSLEIVPARYASEINHATLSNGDESCSGGVMDDEGKLAAGPENLLFRRGSQLRRSVPWQRMRRSGSRRSTSSAERIPDENGGANLSSAQVAR